MQEGGDVLIINAPQMLQHRPSTGRDGAQQAHSTAGVFPDTELPALNGVNATDEGLDLLGQFLGARGEGWTKGVQHEHNMMRKGMRNTSFLCPACQMSEIASVLFELNVWVRRFKSEKASWSMGSMKSWHFSLFLTCYTPND